MQEISQHIIPSWSSPFVFLQKIIYRLNSGRLVLSSSSNQSIQPFAPTTLKKKISFRRFSISTLEYSDRSGCPAKQECYLI